MGDLTKAERVAWWKSLSPQEQEAYIARRQERKTAWRKKHPAKVQIYDPKYPWATEGVSESNREQWQRTILAKNKWLDTGVFDKGQAPKEESASIGL